MAEDTGKRVEFLESRDQSGNTLAVFRYGDDVIPVINGLLDFKRPEEHMSRLREMEARDDDILISAHMKAGTHWIWEVITMLTSGSTEYAAGPKEDAMLEFRSMDKLDALPSPRILNTHLRLSNLPKNLVERKCKIVFIMRNPKDTAVSMYNHISAKGSSFAYKGSFDDFLSLFMSDIVPHNSWGPYITGWEADLASNPDIPCHVMYYEDLKQNPVHEVKMLASFLDVKRTDSFVNDIIDKCSFANLKEGKTRSPDQKKWSFMYKKGEVGGWKNRFTVAQSEAFDKHFTKEMENSKFKFKYSL